MGRPAALLSLAVALPLAAPAPGLAASPARVDGRFAMTATILDATGVRGEHRGQRLRRTWSVVPRGCRGDVCRALRLTRTRAGGQRDRLTLHRRGNRTWVGRGAFYVALRCRGRRYRRGSRAPYAIRLRVTTTRDVGGIRFATGLTARYVNANRTDRTPCTIGAAHDAARYRGRLRAGLPSPPRPAFAATVVGRRTVAFADLSRAGAPSRRRPVAARWRFGDPRSGAADVARGRTPKHRFSRPGRFRVALTVTDRDGLRATVRRTVRVGGAPHPGA